MEKVFLDANIYLDFYRYGKDDLEEMEKLVALINDNEIKLHVNSHLQDEVRRNRENVLAQTIDKISKNSFKFEVPRICEGDSRVKLIREKLSEANKNLTTLINDTKEQALKKELPADKLVNKLFEMATVIQVTNDDIDEAKLRTELGNPPGKKGSIGDAIHWITFLQHDYGDFHVVSRDGDFASELDNNSLDGFLENEWSSKKSYSQIKLYPMLTRFLSENFSNIKLSDEAVKSDLIGQLASSGSFATTHSVIKDLSKYSFFTRLQVVRLIEILVENPQVGWIGSDEDVKKFYLGIENKAQYAPQNLWSAAAAFLEIDEFDYFGFPF